MSEEVKKEEEVITPKEGAKSLREKLEELLSSMKDWERKPIIQVGKAVIELVKLPKRETTRRVEPERLAVHVRFEDSFKGIFIVDYEEFRDLLEALGNEKVKELVEAVSDVNKKKKVIEFKL